MKIVNLKQKQLKEILCYDPLTGIFTRLKTTQGACAGDVAGHKNSLGYIEISISNEKYLAHRLAWLYMTGKWPKHQIDHADHIRSNNKWFNLEEATHQENGKNVSLRSDNKSGVVGVYWSKAREKWVSNIAVDGKTVYLGISEKKEDAIKLRERANIKHGFHENHGRAL